jgi:hypothetical protein
MNNGFKYTILLKYYDQRMNEKGYWNEMDEVSGSIINFSIALITKYYEYSNYLYAYIAHFHKQNNNINLPIKPKKSFLNLTQLFTYYQDIYGTEYRKKLEEEQIEENMNKIEENMNKNEYCTIIFSNGKKIIINRKEETVEVYNKDTFLKKYNTYEDYLNRRKY